LYCVREEIASVKMDARERTQGGAALALGYLVCAPSVLAVRCRNIVCHKKVALSS
jgi:hypothetical protein